LAPLTEQINAAVANPDWNALADPTWLANSAAVVWAEGYACGANAPTLQCAGSGEPGGRNSRVMIARLGIPPTRAVPPPPISNTAPAAWAIPYTATTPSPTPNSIPTGTYTIKGNVFGYATAQITDNSAGTALQSIQVAYHNYVQREGMNVVNGTEEVDTTTVPGDITWNDDLTIFGQQGFGTQVTSPGGFSVNLLDLDFNDFQATGTMTTTLNGVTYTQPANGN